MAAKHFPSNFETSIPNCHTVDGLPYISYALANSRPKVFAAWEYTTSERKDTRPILVPVNCCVLTAGGAPREENRRQLLPLPIVKCEVHVRGARLPHIPSSSLTLRTIRAAHGGMTWQNTGSNAYRFLRKGARPSKEMLGLRRVLRVFVR